MKKTRKFVSIFAILFALVFALSVCFFAACGKKDDGSQDETPVSHDHNYVVDDTTWTFSEDYSECTATAKCTATEGTCDAPTKTVNADVTSNPVSATCTEAGTVTYVATYEGKTVKTSDAIVTDAALGHEVTATWNDTTSGWDYTCSRGDTISDGDAFASTKYMAGSEAALASAFENGGTVELTADIVGTFTVSADTTLDLAGHSITDTTVATTADGENETTQYTVTVDEGASLAVTDSSDDGTGTIICTYAATGNENSRLGAAIYTCGTLNVEGGTISSSSVGILAEAGEVNISDATINSTYYTIFESRGVVTVNVKDGAVVSGVRGIFVAGDSYYGYGDQNEESSYAKGAVTTLNVYEGAEISTSFGSAISTLGLANKPTVFVNIYGGEVTGRGVTYTNPSTSAEATGGVMPAIYMPNGHITVSGGTITGTSALEIKGGDATITGGTFTSTVENANDVTVTPNSSGASSYGYALAVCPYGMTHRNDQSWAENETFDNSVCVEISGGEFDGAVYANITSEGDSFSVTGGTFSEDIEGEYLDVTQYHTELQSTGMYKVASGVAGRNVEGMITADAYVASQPDMGDGSTLDATKRELMNENGTSVSFYGDTATTPSAKISRKNRTSTDGYLFTFAIQLKKASVGSGSLSNCIEVTVTGACTVTVYVMSSNSSSDQTRVLGTWTESSGSYTQDTTTYTVGADADANFDPITISFAAAGTYIIGATDNTINFYGMMISYTA